MHRKDSRWGPLHLGLNRAPWPWSLEWFLTIYDPTMSGSVTSGRRQFTIYHQLPAKVGFRTLANLQWNNRDWTDWCLANWWTTCIRLAFMLNDALLSYIKWQDSSFLTPATSVWSWKTGIGNESWNRWNKCRKGFISSNAMNNQALLLHDG